MKDTINMFEVRGSLIYWNDAVFATTDAEGLVVDPETIAKATSTLLLMDPREVELERAVGVRFAENVKAIVGDRWMKRDALAKNVLEECESYIDAAGGTAVDLYNVAANERDAAKGALMLVELERDEWKAKAEGYAALLMLPTA